MTVHTAEDYGHDPQEGGPWLAVCDHGNTVHGQTRAEVERWATNPAARCSACQRRER